MARSLPDFLRRYGGDERGVVSVMAVGALVLVLAVSMIVIDTGAMLYARRDLQAATDAAALGAVRQLDNAEVAAQSILALNGYSTGDAPEVTVGFYRSDPSLDPEDRFAEADGTMEPSQLNAVRVIKRWKSRTYFARLFDFDNFSTISTEATAAYMKTVSFSTGTRLAELNEGLANQILGGLLGTTLNLSLIDYNALASANIDALSFLDALATEVGLEAGSDTYGDLLETNVTLGDLADAAVEVLNSDSYEGDRANAVQALAQLPAVGVSVPLDRVLNAAPLVERTIGSIGSGISNGLTFNLFSLISGTATVIGEGQAVGFIFALPPLASVTGTVTVGEPMARMAVGGIGDSVYTAQVAVDLQVAINVGIPGLLSSNVLIPIRIIAGEGQATVADIPCEPSGTQTVLTGTTQAGIAHYGAAPGSTFPLATIDLILLPDIQLMAGGSYPIASGGPTNFSFTQSDIESEPPQVKEMSSNISVISGLGSALEVQPAVLNATLGTLLTTVSGVLGALDPILDSLLRTLGVRVGGLDMIVHGVRCNAPTLVL